MDKQLNRIEEKLDKVADRLTSIDVTLGRQEEQLAYHIKRTDMLEEQLAPVKTHVAMVNGALKLVGILGVLGAIIEATVQVAEFIGK